MAEPAAGRISPASRDRDIRIDAAAGALIILVAFGHALSSVAGSRPDAILQWIFLFHVPAFVFLSGYVTRYSSHWSPWDLAGRLLLPFIILQLVHRMLISVITGNDFSSNLPAPAWSLWYLVSLFCWRLLAPVIGRLPALLALSGAVVASLAIGLVDWADDDFSIARTIGFLPFFVAGLLWRESWWRPILARGSWIAGAFLLGVAAIWAKANFASVNRKAWWFSAPYSELGQSPASGIAMRAAILVVAAVLTLAVLTVVMRRQPTLAQIGVVSLQVYVLHPLLLYPWHVDGAPSWFATRLGIAVLFIATCVFAWLASRPIVTRAMRPLLDYRWWRERVRVGR